jgi:type IV secretion system protein VirB5
MKLTISELKAFFARFGQRAAKPPPEVVKDVTENPYLTARRTWNDHVGSVIAQRQWWQIIGLFALCISLALAGGMIHVASQSKFIPYVVEVDKVGGNILAMGPVSSTSPVDARIIQATLIRIIQNARLVTPDVNLQRKAIFDLYAHLNANDPALQKMNEIMGDKSETNPFKRATNEMVGTEIRSALQQTPETWQIEWIETVRDRKGAQISVPTVWRALVQVYVAPPTSKTTPEQMMGNPLGIYISDFSWSRLN